MLVAIYIRVSHRDSLEGYSLEAQERKCREYAAAQGWVVVEVYCDPAITAHHDRRPELQRMLAELRDKRIEVVLVLDLDRAFRNLRDQLNAYHDLVQRKVRLASVVDQIDTSTPEGIFHFQAKGMMSEWLVNQISRKVKIAFEEAAEQGRWVGGFTPFGYDRGPDGWLVPNEDAPIVQRIYIRYVTGTCSYTTIADELNAAGFRIRDQWTKMPRLFGRATIRNILSNRAYLGLVHHTGKEYPGLHEPLIDEETWTLAARVRA
jgi:site-specific DNA recombinase